MDILLDNTLHKTFQKEIIISGSKSESNRLLILKQIFPNLEINNIGNADDVVTLQNALSSENKEINIGHAGTAMRFLTAYLSSLENTVILTGSSRMQKRPIKLLVDVLNNLGANITYLKEEGFPPIKIIGTKNLCNSVKINGSVSSQYITALLLIAPSLKKGLKIELLDKISSKPYIEMTLALLDKIGVNTKWHDNTIQVCYKETIKNIIINVESDWSSASYFYSLVALSVNGRVTLTNFNKKSLQGDKELVEIYKQFGVKTIFNKQGIILSKEKNYKQKKHVSFHLIKTPDIAQTVAVTSYGLGISCALTGLHTLKIKETDRLEALKIELIKLGAKVRITEESIHIKSDKVNPRTQSINTYQDHRMAMAFAPLSLLFPIIIKDADVVNKSYPNFWKDFEKI